MPVPSNYLTIDSYPYSRVITQAEFNGGTFGNSANEVWFRLEITDVREVLGFYIATGGTFSPRWLLYGENGDTDPALFDVSSASNPSWYYAFSNTEANPYYLRVIKRPAGGAPSDFDFTFNADNRPLPVQVRPGDIIVNDDTGTDLPSAVLDPESGEVLGYVDIPASEHGALLVSGDSAWYDRFGMHGDPGTFAIFDRNYEYLVSTTQVFNDPPSVTASADQIFVLDSGTGEVYEIDIDSGAATLVATLAHADTTSIGVDVDGTILYYVDASGYIQSFGPSDNVIHAWDLETDTALPDLYTEPDLDTDDGGLAATANLWPGEILVLPDGSVVTWVQNETALHDILIHVDSEGNLLNSYTYDWSERQINHIAYVNSGSEEVAVWFYDPTFTIATIVTVTLASGSESLPIDLEMFSNGQNLTGNSDQPVGMSSSCTFIIAGARSGIPRDNSIQCPCPCPCPEDPKRPSPGVTGLILPPMEPTWDRNCAGEGEVPQAADVTDPESWAA